MIVAAGTKNRAKLDAVKNVFSKVWKDIEVVSVDSKSGVREQPMSDEEAIEGAINRAEQALGSVANAAYGVGLEGSAHENKYGTFLGGWVAIVDAKGKVGIGASGKAQLPDWIAERLRRGEELGPITQNLMDDKENKIRHSQGTLGILTNGLYSRIDEFEEATKCALAKFISEDFYKSRGGDKS